MELPNDIWNLIIDRIGYASLGRDLYARASFLFLPLVNKQLHQLCKTHPSVLAHYEEHLDYTLILEQFARNGNLSCIKFAHENGFGFDNLTHFRIIDAAATKDNYDILEYLISHGHPYSQENLKSIIIGSESKDLRCLEYIHKMVRIPFVPHDIEKTIQYGYLEKCEYLWAQGIRPKWTSIPSYIISNPMLASMVDNLLQKNYRADIKSFEFFYEKGDISMYEYTYNNGYSWPDDITAIAVRKNQLAALQYAHEHGAPWHLDTCLVASENGAYNCLSYAHEHGAEWNNQACLERATEYLRRAVEAQEEPDWGFSLGVVLPVYDEPGLMKCIKYLLAHQNCIYGSDSHVVPSEAEQTNLCKDYLDQQAALTNVNFSVMYNRIDPPLTSIDPYLGRSYPRGFKPADYENV